MTENLDRLRELLAYYGSLDKTTVLALINRTEAAEREATAAKSVLARHITERSLELHRTAGLAVDTAVEAVVKLLVDDPDKRAREAEARAEAAESAVQRVREVLTLEEIEALPVGTILRDYAGLALHKRPTGTWWCTNGATRLTDADLANEIEGTTFWYTVLWVPMEGGQDG